MATRSFLGRAAIAGAQQLPCWMLTTRSGVHEPSAAWCRSRMQKTFPRAPCHATQTFPAASVVATGLTSFPELFEIWIGSESFPPAQERARISKLAVGSFGQLWFSDQNSQALPSRSTATLHLYRSPW